MLNVSELLVRWALVEHALHDSVNGSAHKPLDTDLQIGRSVGPAIVPFKSVSIVIVQCSNDIAASALHTRRPIPGVKNKDGSIAKSLR